MFLTSHTSRIPALAAGLGIAFASAGCQSKSQFPETVPVTGKVSYKGQPVTKGTVTFQSDEGHSAVGPIGEGGEFRLSTFGDGDGAVPGHHRVLIIANDGDEHMIPGSSPGYKKPKDIIPKKYGKVETSGLEQVVSKEKQVYDIAID